jgi:YVTN family beta-propeller protein
MKRNALKIMVLGSFLALLTRNPLSAQTVVGKITKPDLVPTAVAVYEKGNEVCIADKTSGNLLIYDGTTLAELGSVPLGLGAVSWMVVNETFGKLYATNFDFYPLVHVTVVDLDAMTFLRDLDLNDSFPILTHDEGWDKLYVLNGGGLYQVDVATDAITPIPGPSGKLNEDIALNPVTHEIYISQMGPGLTIVDGSTLSVASFPDFRSLGVGINWIQNKAVLGYAKAPGVDFDMCVFDHITNSIVPLPDIKNDGTEFAFNPSSQKMYSSSEIYRKSAIIEGATNAFFNLGMDSPTARPEIRYSTNHVYYPGQDYIGVLDDATQLLSVISVPNANPSNSVYQSAAVNQTTGRVYVINDGLALNFVTVLQDEPVLRHTLYLASLDSWYSSHLFVFDTQNKKFKSSAFPLLGVSAPYPDKPEVMAFPPGGGWLYASQAGSPNGYLGIFAGLGDNAGLGSFDAGGYYPVTPAWMPDGKSIYVTNFSSNSVTVFDVASRTVRATIPVGANPLGAAVTPSGTRVFAANNGGSTVSVIDTSLNLVLQTLPVGAKPWGVAINPSGAKAYVSNQGDGTVSVIDIAGGKVIKTVPVGTNPRWMAFSPEGADLFVINYDSRSLSVIDAGTDTVIRTVPLSGNPECMCVMPDGHEIYIGSGQILSAITLPDFSVTDLSIGNRTLALAAADQYARLAGRVFASGVPVQGALVRVLQGGIEKGRATSNASGDYALPCLLAGTYDIECAESRCSTQTLTGRAVLWGRTAVNDFLLTFVAPTALTLTSPNGSENWTGGSVHRIAWSTIGSVGPVKLEYSVNGGAVWSTIAVSTGNDGSYDWTVPSLSSTNCLVRVSEAETGSPADASNAVFTLVAAQPAIRLSRTVLNFGARASSVTPAQTVFISNSGGGTLQWTAMASAAWITLSKSSGTGGGTLLIGVNTAGSANGIYAGTVTFTDPGATNSPQIIALNLQVYPAAGMGFPMGSFDTPVEGTAGITGAIPVTGWVVDDIEVTKVEVKRDQVTGDPQGAVGPDGLIFIGSGIFVDGARPDIETTYSTYPMCSKAGWGYMLLTNFLPSMGNGTFKLYAIATDKEGNVATLGTKTITCSNAAAVKPFGTIDTPAQGGDASGNPYLNFGWVLTPQPKTVPKNGSTIQVYVDSVLLGTLQTAPNVYDQYRPDVSGNFPGLNNTGAPGAGGPVGAYFLDTTKYPNGVHTIWWIAFDDAGQGDGIGSRYFNIVNTGSSPGAMISDVASVGLTGETLSQMDKPASLPRSHLPIRVGTGLRLKDELRELFAEADGVYRVEIPEVDRVVIELGKEAKYSGYLVVGDTLRPLPIGSTLDPRTGRFSWMPGPGFRGMYRLIFAEEAAGVPRTIRVSVHIMPKI